MNDIHSQITDKIPVQVYADLYYAAEKYDIKDIREICKKFMIDHCDIGNTHFLLGKAKLFNLPVLEAICKTTFANNTYMTLLSHLKLNLDDEILSEFYALEALSIFGEYDLYIALEAVVDNETLPCHIKCLGKIRFLTMKIKDVLTCNLLSAEDKCAVIANIEALKHRETATISMPAYLSKETKPRQLHDK